MMLTKLLTAPLDPVEPPCVGGVPASPTTPPDAALAGDDTPANEDGNATGPLTFGGGN